MKLYPTDLLTKDTKNQKKFKSTEKSKLILFQVYCILQSKQSLCSIQRFIPQIPRSQVVGSKPT